jgi:hypothetical protein
VKIEKGRIESPDRDLLYGTEGVGKTTYASLSDNPVFLTTEEGTNELDVARLRRDNGMPLETYEEARESITWLRTNEHGFRTLVIDTVDWLDHWIQAWVCNQNNWSSIETPGYGKGYIPLMEEWRNFLHSLELLQREKRIHVLFLGHAHVKRYQPPDLEGYDRYSLKVPDGVSSLVREWCFGVFFAQLEVAVEKQEGKTKQARGFDTGRRILYTTETASVRAKNRSCLPPTLVFDRDTFNEIRRYRHMNPNDLLEQIFKDSPKAKEKEKETREWFSKQPDKLFAVKRMRERIEQGA